jgi:hypothetical protein
MGFPETRRLDATTANGGITHNDDDRGSSAAVWLSRRRGGNRGG